MGSPEFAVPCLRSLVDHYTVTGVVTQPDRPSGRGQNITASPVKLLSDQLGLPTIQPRRLRDPDAIQQLNSWAPDLIIVVAFGQILRSAVLDLPRLGCINVHGSLLPRWRGAAPVQAAILHGDAQTGITIMRMDPGIDTGPILRQRQEAILPTDTYSSLARRLSITGAELLIETLPEYVNEDLQPTPQNEEHATYAPMLKKEDGLLDFNLSAAELERKVRALNPWPGAFLLWSGHHLKIHRASVLSQEINREPGKFLVWEGKPVVNTSNGLLVLEEVQPAGKRIMSGTAFQQGNKKWGV